MKRKSQKHKLPIGRPAPPPELAGKWVAWSSDDTQIVAHADTFMEVKRIVDSEGINGASYQRLPALRDR